MVAAVQALLLVAGHVAVAGSWWRARQLRGLTVAAAPALATLWATAGALAWVLLWWDGGGASVGAVVGRAGWVACVLLAVAALCPVFTGIAGLRRINAQARVSSPVAEAALCAAAVVTVVWAVLPADTDVDHAWPPAPGLVLATVDLTALALVARMAVSAPRLVTRARSRPILVAAAAAATLTAAADLLWAVSGSVVPLGGSASAAVVAQLLLRLAAAAGVACLPWVGRLSRAPLRRPPRGWRAIPYLLVGVAVGVVVVRAAAGEADVTLVWLGGVVVVALVGALGLALRENTLLMADLEASRQRLNALLESTGDVIVRIDVQGLVVSANRACARLLGRPASVLVGRPLWEVAAAVDADALRVSTLDVAAGETPQGVVEVRLAEPGGRTAQVRLQAAAGGAVATLHDVTDAVRLRRRLERLARFDQLTGLANRPHLMETLGEWLADGAEVVVVYADLDGFKAVNDRFGHLAGDAVLREVAQRMRAVLERHGPGRRLAARLGGDEFVIALRDSDETHARPLAEALVSSLRVPFLVRDRAVGLGVSVGTATLGVGRSLDGDPEGAAELVHRADLAMFAAKAAGKGRVRGWEPALDEQAHRRVDIAIELRRALDAGRLALAFQPIVRLADGVVVAAEALVRVPEPAADAGPDDVFASLRGLVSPSELVEVAEDTGAISEMGAWVLTEAARAAVAWRAQGHDVQVAVNLSVGQLADEDLPEVVARILADTRLPAHALILEITESRLMGPDGPAMPVLLRLRDLGVWLAIDDFGTGYSTLSSLRLLPVRVLKLDRSFLDGIAEEPQARAVVRAVVELSRALDLMVVAEGLETAEAVTLLRELGVEAGQGFVLSPAVSASAWPQALARRGMPARIVDLDGVAPGAEEVVSIPDAVQARDVRPGTSGGHGEP